MDDLTVEKIIEIHDEVIANYEGTSGLLSEATLDYLVYRLNREKRVIRRAALAMHAIGSQHPFIDGNLRRILLNSSHLRGLLTPQKANRPDCFRKYPRQGRIMSCHRR
jgi:hypothetical protein